HTGYIAEHYPEGFHGTAPREEQLVAMTCAAAFVHETFVRRAAQIEGRMRPASEPDIREWVVLLDKRRIPVEIEMTGPGRASLWAPSLASARLEIETAWRAGQHLFEATINGDTIALEFADRTEGYQLRHRGFSATALVCTARAAELHALLPEKEKPDMAKLVVSPMPGLVVSLEVEVGQTVKTGEPLVIVEAMKMENVLRAETDGTIKTITVEPGASVAADELLVEFE
uniref:biotin/lipoyl-containing protein n=1 Tax=uncultured Maricaulis sp. TaxID=174710 RepID=UPI0030DA221B